MATLAKKNTLLGVKKETTQGTVINPVDADFVLIDDDFTTEMSYEEIERNALNGNLDPLASLVGMQDGSAEVTIELKGSGTAHTVTEYDALLKACFDDPTDPLSGGDDVLTGTPSATVVDVGNSPGFAVGDICAIDVAAGAFEFALVTGVTGTTTQTLTITPDLSGVPAPGQAIKSGITYKPQSSGHDFLSIHFFFDCDGQDGFWVKFGGCRPNMVLSNLATGQIPKMQFNLTPINWAVQSTGSNLGTLGLSPVLDTDTLPPLCLESIITLGTARADVHTQNAEFDLGLEVTRRMSMIATGGYRSSRYTQRGVNGKFDMDLEDIAQYTAWTAQTEALLLMSFGDTWGNRPVIIVPKIQRTQVEPVDSDGLWTQDITWKANRSTTLEPIYLALF